MRCCRDIVFGPGDDYGRDKLLEDWECPPCHEKLRFTRRNIRTGINVCPKCGWQSEYAVMINNKLDKISSKVKK